MKKRLALKKMKQEYCKTEFPKLMDEFHKVMCSSIDEYRSNGYKGVERILPFKAELEDIKSKGLSTRNAKRVLERLDTMSIGLRKLGEEIDYVQDDVVPFFIIDDIAQKASDIANSLYSNVMYGRVMLYGITIPMTEQMTEA